VLSEEQAAFGNGRSTTDNLYCVTQLTEKRLEVLQEINLVFVDLKEAYDNIQINILWEALENTGISMQIIQALNTYTPDQFQR
jgi:multidrug efflux pump subunit AcrB